jgi:hypothetical protein
MARRYVIDLNGDHWTKLHILLHVPTIFIPGEGAHNTSWMESWIHVLVSEIKSDILIIPSLND